MYFGKVMLITQFNYSRVFQMGWGAFSTAPPPPSPLPPPPSPPPLQKNPTCYTTSHDVSLHLLQILCTPPPPPPPRKQLWLQGCPEHPPICTPILIPSPPCPHTHLHPPPLAPLPTPRQSTH